MVDLVAGVASGGGGDPLKERVELMRESLQKSQAITDNMVSIFGSFDHRLSALETAMRPTQIMQALQNNLDGKSKQYKDASLTYLFLMNNIHYMVRSVRRSEAKDLLGDDWVQRHRRIVQQHANLYKRHACIQSKKTMILQCLSIQGLTSSGGSSATWRK